MIKWKKTSKYYNDIFDKEEFWFNRLLVDFNIKNRSETTSSKELYIKYYKNITNFDNINLTQRGYYSSNDLGFIKEIKITEPYFNDVLFHNDPSNIKKMRYFNNNIQNYIVENEISSLAKVKKPSHNTQMTAVKKRGKSLRHFINIASHEVIVEAINQDPECIKYFYVTEKLKKTS